MSIPIRSGGRSLSRLLGEGVQTAVAATSRRCVVTHHFAVIPRSGATSRNFTNTPFLREEANASTSTSSSTATESTAEKPKKRRVRRTQAEIALAKLEAEKLGISPRSKRRSKSALTGSPAYIESEAELKRSSSRTSKSKAGSTETRKSADAEGSEATKKDVSEEMGEEGAVLESMKEMLKEMEYDHLPPRSEWKKAFPTGKQYQTGYRYFVCNRATIRDIIAHLELEAPERKGKKVTIVEGYPGPGTFASELVKLPIVEKVIGLEATPRYYAALEKLKKKLAEEGNGDRLDMVKSSAYLWETYNDLFTSGKLSHLNNRIPTGTSPDTCIDFNRDDFQPTGFEDPSWQEISPIIYLAQLPNTVYGEQLFAQLITAIASRSWLFRHGRIQMAFVCGESLAKRCLGQPGDKTSRGKLGTTVQCLADVQVHKYPADLQPHGHHFYPTTLSIGPRVPLSGTSLIPNSNPSTGLTRTGLVMMTVTPKQKPLLDVREIEAFEFITRNMFILRTKSVEEALTHVAPGGQNVLKMLTQKQVEKGLITKDQIIKPEEIVNDLTNEQWAALARTFEKWPFRPKHLFEEGRIKSDGKRT